MKKRKQSEEGAVRQLGEDLLKEVATRGRLEGQWRAGEILRWEAAERLKAVTGWLAEAGLAEPAAGGWRLTLAGRNRAVELLRAHRLVETYLAREQGRSTRDLHAEADRVEHLLSSERINELADVMNRPRFDPHGDPIPERARDLHWPDQGVLTEATVGKTLRIAHIEDEPEADFRELMELGFAVELPLRVESQSGEETVIELAGEEVVLPFRLARHIEVTPLLEGEAFPADLRRLSSLKLGESGRVEFISPACLGPERRRLLDFGMVPGSAVKCEFKSPFGSPVAYSVRGSTIGLRESQARNIFIRREG